MAVLLEIPSMRSVSVSLSLTGLFLFFSACDKHDDKPALEKGLKGRVLYTSCVTIAVQVLLPYQLLYVLPTTD